MIEFQPLGARVVVVLKDLPEKVGSLYRIGTNEIARQATVLRIGPECRECREGDTVVVNPLSFQWVGDELVGPESSVLAFIENDPS